MSRFTDEAGGDSDGSSGRSTSPTEGPLPGRRPEPATFVVRFVDDIRKMAKKKHPVLFVCLAICFGILSVALIIFILAREMTIVQELQERCGSQRQYLEFQYPGYFRTSQQQKVYIEALKERKLNLPDTVEALQCQFQCQDQPLLPPSGVTNAPTRKRRDSNLRWTYHSCCQSYKNHSSSPTYRQNLRGQRKELVQTSEYRQYFPEEVCQQVRGCSGCQCAQPEEEVTQAVVYKNKNAAADEERYELDYLKFSGCCKCLNIGRS